jgi:cobalt-zinc-cadmium efflux system membrane fusion protein
MADAKMRMGKLPVIAIACALAVVFVLAGALLPWGSGKSGSAASTAKAAESASPDAAAKPKDPNSVDLTETQVKALQIGPAGTHVFAVQSTAVGSIDFNENRSVQVFTPYQGKIIQAFGDVGDEVSKGKTLFTIDSPDLVQAESALITAAGVYELTTEALKRARGLYETQGIAQKDLEQAVSDQQAADAALKGARAAVRVFGKSDAEIDAIIAKRTIDPALVVPSPVSGRITARVAQPGLLVQPGNPPAPFTIADMSTVWMIANVTEAESPQFRLGQEVKVKVMALPQTFEGKITTIGAAVDPNTHTVLVRSEVRDPQRLLRPGMMATFVIRTGNPVSAIGVAQNGVVREGDGTMSIWVTTDRRHFTRRTVTVGLRQDGYDQIVEGLNAGELVVSDGAIFLSNMLVASPDT